MQHFDLLRRHRRGGQRKHGRRHMSFFNMVILFLPIDQGPCRTHELKRYKSGEVNPELLGFDLRRFSRIVLFFIGISALQQCRRGAAWVLKRLKNAAEWRQTQLTGELRDDPRNRERPTLSGTEKPTLRTIAQATGFSVATVSRALADDPRIAARTRATVAEAAKGLGYMPDRAARRLRTGRTQVITLLLNTEHEFLGFTHEFLSGITEALHGTGYSVTVVPDDPGEDRLAPVRTILRNNLADGLLFTRTECFDPRVRMLMEAGLPFVSHGRTEFTMPHPFVDFDNEAFARQAVARLVGQGRDRLSMILPDDKFTFCQHLRYGFVSAARAAGVDHEVLDGRDARFRPRPT
jgi:hypothetical protein